MRGEQDFERPAGASLVRGITPDSLPDGESGEVQEGEHAPWDLQVSEASGDPSSASISSMVGSVPLRSLGSCSRWVN